jgi:hypothetical protein
VDVVALPVAKSPSAESPGRVLNSKKTAQSPTKHGSKRRGQVHTYTHTYTHTHTHTHTKCVSQYCRTRVTRKVK